MFEDTNLICSQALPQHNSGTKIALVKVTNLEVVSVSSSSYSSLYYLHQYKANIATYRCKLKLV